MNQPFHIAIVDSKIINDLKYPLISKRLAMLSENQLPNITTINPCGIYDTCTDSVYLMCLIQQVSSENDLEANADIIIGCLTAITFKSTQLVEIYNVFTDPLYRKKGVGIFLLTHVINLFSAYKLWLAIVPENPSWDNALRLYVKTGFRQPSLTTITAAGKLLNFSVISLIYLKSISDSEMDHDLMQNETIVTAQTIRQKYLASQTTCSNMIHIGSKVCASLREYIERDREFSGILIQNKYIIRDGQRYANLVYPIQTEIPGDAAPNFTVHTPSNIYNFHTHPAICYEHLNCFIGFPSSQDMTYVITQYQTGLRKHFVVTVEGIYSIQMTPEFMKYWTSIFTNLHLANNILYNLLNLFLPSEDIRSKTNLPADDPTKDRFIQDQYKTLLFQFYITTANSLDFQTLSTKLDTSLTFPLPTNNFVLFIVHFYSWSHIDSHKGFLDTMNYLPDQHSCDINVSLIGDDEVI